MVDHPGGQALVIVFKRELTLALLRSDLGESVRLDGVVLKSASATDVNGFYDWLREKDGTIIGVRYWPSPESSWVVGAVASLPYVQEQKRPERLDIFFSSDRRAIDEQGSDDQAFGGNRLFRSGQGELAIAFEMYFLSAGEIESIRQVRARWLSAG